MNQHQELHRTRPAPATPTAGSGLPVLPPAIALLEILLLIVVPAALDYLVPAFPSLNDGQPHFFWLPVLLLSMQYGPASGLLAAGTAIALSALLGWPEQEIGENHFSYLLRIWLQPLLWLAAAIILGQFRLHQLERKEALTREVAELTAQRQAISDHARHLRQRCEELERTIAAERAPEARQMLTALARLQSAETPFAAEALHEAAHLAFGDCTMSVWVRDRDTLRMSERHGAQPGEPRPQTIAARDAIYQAVVDHGRSLSVMQPGDERELSGWGLAAVPLSSPGQAATGMVLLERAEPAALDRATALHLAVLARALADRITRADASTAIVALSARPAGSPASDPSARQPPWRRARWQRQLQRLRAGSGSG